MRKDMSKVVIERPRYGYSDPSEKTGIRIRRYDENEAENIATWRGVKSKNNKWNSKSFTDFLEPLRGLLHKNVGRPWDKVYSEICEHLDRRKTTGAHVFQHLFGFVAVNCYFDEDGELWAIGYYGEPQLMRDQVYRRFHYYVHPESRLLCRYDLHNKRDARRKFEARKQKERRKIERKQISYDQSYVRINGVWYIGDYVAEADGSAPELPPALNYSDTAEKRWQRVADFGTRYWNGKRWMQLTSKRKCTQQELQKAGLRNANPAFGVL